MRFLSETDGSIMVELSSEDMQRLDITYDMLDYSNIETRRVLWTVLDEARLALGRDIDISEKMLIEAIPSADGGCVFYFSRPARAKRGDISLRLHERESLCRMSSADELLSLLEFLKGLGRGLELEVFCDGREYAVLLLSELEPQLLAEFGYMEKSIGLCAAHLREHWRSLGVLRL